MRVVFGACTLDLDRRELCYQGRVQPLEPKAFTVLAYLLVHRDRAIAKEELLTACWAGEFVSEAALARCVQVMRRAVADDGEQQQVIKTLRGFGYRFVATVEILSAPAALPSRPQEQPSPPTYAGTLQEPAASAAALRLPAVGRAAPAATRPCPQCQMANRATRQFCAACGHTLWQPCLHCGFDNDTNEHFCGGCGRAVSAPVSLSLGVHPGPPRAYTPAYVASKILASQREIVGEHKIATVLVASIEAGQAGQPGEAPAAVDEVVPCGLALLATEVYRVEGFVSQMSQHGFTALFGAPLACEDHAVRALHAALGMQRAFAAYATTLPQPHGMGLTLRLGVHTGPVVVSAISSDLQLAYTAPGATIAVAMGLQQLRRDDAIVLSAAVQQEATGFFRFTTVGAHRLPELAEPVDVAICEGVASVTSRLEGTLVRQHTAFQGRTQELALLQTCWARASQGTGQVVCLVGEAGIGKSRLAYECRQAFGAARWHTAQALSYGQAMPYHALIPLLRTVLGMTDTAPSTQQLLAIRTHLTAIDPSLAADTPLLARLLGFPVSTEDLPALAPEAQRRRLQHICCQVLLQQAADAPLCLLVEDGHWLDPSSQEILDLLVAALARRPILLLCTARPGLRHAWTDYTYFHQVAVAPLGVVETAALLRDLVRPYAVAPALVAWIQARTGGNPLFVEELVRTMQAQGLFVLRHNLYEVDEARRLALPVSVQGIVQTRLDRLPAVEKSLLQLAAVIGPAVPVPLLQALVNEDPEELQRRLRALQAAELLYETDAISSPTYTFKHALVQDAAYQSLLPRIRQQIHQQIAQVLEQQFPDTVARQPELLAQHYTEAALYRQAVAYWQRAGEVALQRSAHVEASAHLTTGLKLVTTLLPTPERHQQELALHLALGAALRVSKGFGAPEVERAYTRACDLAQRVGDTPQSFWALNGLRTFYLVHGQLQTSHVQSEQLLRMAESQQDALLLVTAHSSLGHSHFYRGELPAAHMHEQQAHALHTPEQDRSLALLHGVSPGASSLAYAAMVRWLLGFPQQGLLHSRAVTLAQEIRYPPSLALPLAHAAWFCQFRREAPAVQAQAEALLPLATGQEFPFWRAMATILRGWALMAQGQGAVGIAEMQQGLAAYQATGAAMGQTYLRALLVEGCRHVGQVDTGLRLLAEILATVEKTGERVWEAELYRLKGELLLHAEYGRSQSPSPPLCGRKLRCAGAVAPSESASFPPPTQSRRVRRAALQAESCFQQALAIARRQQAKSLELRATMSLARLWQQQGKRAAAHQLLVEVYGWFTEGFGTADLQEARALLVALSG
jgi:DNA-binding winged helix-turn-helix (wHTH) protein/class 3 adenylate cyclase/predicted ATPase